MALCYANTAFAYITDDIPNGCDEIYADMYPVFKINEYTCNAGYYLPANGIECVPCRPGYTCAGGTYTFNPTHEQGIELVIHAIVPPNGIAGCDAFYGNMYPRFKINEYTCGAGYYLPANYDGCVPCPQNATCMGGTFQFNERVASGITYAQPITTNVSRGCNANLSGPKVARFTINEYDCAAGYYVPANNDGCMPCPADSYCPGGHYVFNETMAQGINTCADGLHTPAGMWESDQCGRILHIGENVLYLRATKKTAHALHAKVGNDIFYGNMTTADVPMSATATQKLKVKLGDTIYSVYDDSINPGE